MYSGERTFHSWLAQLFISQERALEKSYYLFASAVVCIFPLLRE